MSDTYRSATPSGRPDDLVISQDVAGSGDGRRRNRATDVHDIAGSAQHSDVIIEASDIEVGVQGDRAQSVDDAAAVGPSGSHAGSPSVYCVTPEREFQMGRGRNQQPRHNHNIYRLLPTQLLETAYMTTSTVVP